MESYKIKGRKFSMPSGWHEVTYSNALKILKGDMSEIQIFSLLSGLSTDEVRDIDDYNSLVYFMGTFSFIKETIDASNAQIPRSFKYDGEIVISPYVFYEDPTDLGKCSVGQITDMKKYLADSIQSLQDGDEERLPTEYELMELMPAIVSIYVQKLIDKKYDYTKAIEISKDISDKMSYKDMTNMGCFFLRKLTAYMNGSQRTFRRRSWIIRKSKQGLKSLMIRLDSILP